jgi:Pyruvate/2-oxoacid:ferredoxin oxidoreductase delta subunit
MSRPLVVISGHKTPDALDSFEQAVLDQCLEHGLDCLLIPPLYHIPESSDLWPLLATRLKNAVLLCRLHPRPAEWLLQHHNIGSQRLAILDLRSFRDAKAAVSAVLASLSDGRKPSPKPKQQTGKTERLAESTKPRWYPVLDGSRCVNCQHCLQFCLFGVYELDAEGRVAVHHPDQCKPGCPACSRICPQSAIMFPLYEKDAAIAGAPGEFVALDAEARKMFYTRTRQPCPVCGRVAETKRTKSNAKDDLCPECGRPRLAKNKEPAARPAFDDLDELVDRLDQQMQRRR